MAISSIGTPTLVKSATSPVTASWGTGQQPSVAGNLMVAVLTAGAATSVGATAQNTGTTGWTNLAEIVSGTTNNCRVSIWTKTSVGSDAAPAFTSTISGTGAMTVTLYNLAGAVVPPVLDTSGSENSGNSSASVASTAVTTGAAPKTPGDFAIMVACRERAAANTTVTGSAGWTLNTNDGGASSVLRSGVQSQASPSTGGTLSGTITWSGTATTAFGAGYIAVFSAITSGPPLAASVQSPAGLIVSQVRTGVAMASLIPSAAATPPPTPTSGPPFFPAPQPARARIPQAAPRGRVTANPGGPVRNPVPPVTGPVFYPARQAIRARLPQPPAGMGAMRGRCASSPPAPVRNPSPGPRFAQKPAPVRFVLPPWRSRAGRVGSSPGAPVANPRRGPPFYPRNSEVRAAFPQQPLLRGRTASSRGAPVANPNVIQVASGAISGALRAALLANPRGRVRVTPLAAGTPPVHAGPPFFPFRWPVQAQDPLPRRGRIAGVSPGSPARNPLQGPAFRPATAPARARLPLPLRGRTSGNPGAPVRNPVPGNTGPVFRPATAPARIRPLLPQRGRAGSSPGAPVANPVISPPPAQAGGQPAGIRVIYLTAGRTQSSPGGPVRNPAPGNTGPVFYPRNFAGTRNTLPRRGTCRAIRFWPLPSSPASGPVFRPVTSPAQARVPLPRRGRVASSPGAPVRNPVPGTTGPVFRPRNSAAPRQPLPRRGAVRAIRFWPLPANPSQGPVFRPATSPVQARFPLPARGRAAGNPGGPVRNPAPVTTGPPFRPATSPPRTRPGLPPRGRVTANPGAAPRNPVHGPAVYAWHGPVRAPVPQPFSKGRVTSNPGGPVVFPVTPAPVYPAHGPVAARRPLPPHGRVITGNPGGPVRNPAHGPVFRPLDWPARTRIPQNAPRGRTSSNPGGPVENIPVTSPVIRLGSPYFQWDTELAGSDWETGGAYQDWATGVAYGL